MKKEFFVNGMACEKCVERVKNALLSQDEVNDVEVSLETGKVVLELSSDLDDSKISELITDLGYEYKN
jgi:Cu+-exporting ATPase